MLLQRPDDLEAWTRCLGNCVANGLITAEEKTSILAAGGIEDYMILDLKSRLFEKSVNKAQFGFAYDALYRQLVKVVGDLV